MARSRDRDIDAEFDDDDYDGGASRGAPPPNYLVQSILVTLCCCLPLGIVGIIFAAQVNSKWESGDRRGAQEASAKAKQWSTIGFICGIVVNAIAVVAQVALQMAAR